MPHTSARTPRLLLALCLLAGLSGCSSWREVARHREWTLLERPQVPVAREAYEAAFEPAMRVVQAEFGPFRRRVKVHAWHGAVGIQGEGRELLMGSRDGDVQEVAGIGPALIPAFHARGVHPFQRSGIFIGVPDVGTAVHELVHARLAEDTTSLPLWFEEGVATFFGDGALVNGEWIVDGFSAWPWRELREEEWSQGELEGLLSIESTLGTSMREDVLVHFIGWAIVYDLWRETASTDWQVWLAAFDHEDLHGDGARRLARTLSDETLEQLLSGLEAPDPGQRIARAKGLWKLRSSLVVERLALACKQEADPEACVALAVNLLAGLGEQNVSTRRWFGFRRILRETLGRGRLDQPTEAAALVELRKALAGRVPDTSLAETAMEGLSRFWEE